MNQNRRRLILAVIVAAYFGVCIRWPQWMDRMGIGHLGHWFIDMRAVLAASDAHAMGIAADAKNPLDLFNQPHVYPETWFLLARLHLDRTDYTWLGAIVAFTFLAIALTQVKVRRTSELIWSAVALCAPPMIFGFNRANVDLLIFITLCAIPPCLLSGRCAVRWLSVAVIIVATAMKYYPAVVLLLLFVPNRPRRELLLQVGVATVCIAAFAIFATAGMGRYQTSLQPTGFFTFGLATIPQLVRTPAAATFIFGVVLASVCAVQAWRFAPPLQATVYRDDDYLKFILGVVILVTCYFVTTNYLYRLIVAVWMVPYLWKTAADSAMPYFRVRARIVAVLLGIILWFDAVCCVFINTTSFLSMAQVNVWTDRLLLTRAPIDLLFVLLLVEYLVVFGRDSLRALIADTQPGHNSFSSHPS